MIVALKYIGLILGSYLLGSVIFAKLISKKEKHEIEKQGSGNPGTMNMLRTHGVLTGFLTFLLDALKGAISALAGFFLFGGADGGITAKFAMYLGGFFAVIGHIFPVYYKFKGGKGVATTAGMVFVVRPIVGLILFACYIVLLITTKIGSLSSLIIAVGYIVSDTVLLILDKNYFSLILIYVIFVLVIWAHRANIKRMAKKQENLVDLKAAVQKDIDRINSIKTKKKTENQSKEVEETKQEELSQDKLKTEVEDLTKETNSENLTKENVETNSDENK